MLVADISRAQLSLVPCLRGDRRVKNHRIALLALQQYNQCLLVCLSPAAVCMILFLIITGRKPHLKPNETSYSSQLSGCTHSQWSKHTRRKRKLTLRWVIRYKSGCKDESGLINVRHASGRGSVCLLGLRYEMDTKYQSRRVMKVLLLKAGDVESNPGPKRGLSFENFSKLVPWPFEGGGGGGGGWCTVSAHARKILVHRKMFSKPLHVIMIT